MDGLQHIIESKRELLRRETFLRTPIIYSKSIAEDQKDRYIRYLAKENLEHILTEKAMQLALEDFMAEQKALEERMAAFESQCQELKDRLSEERKLRKSAERKARTLREQLDYARIGVRESGKRRNPAGLKSLNRTVKTKKTVLTGRTTIVL